MFFSSIADAFPSTLNRLYQARDAAQRRGQSIIDLVSGNVHQAGIFYPDIKLKESLVRALQKTRVYQPDSFGQLVAREAISEYYQRAGLSVPANQVLLTPGTSLSYFYCFKLLAESGDEILCPSPAYPLFETIAKLCRVQLTSYRLLESGRWTIGMDYLESQLTTRTRAIVVISPHNPTGAVASASQLDDLAAIASRHRLAIIADEVFSEFLFDLDELPRPAKTNAPLVFTLNGFSKMLALPGLKLGWMAVSGEPSQVQRAIRALEMISDTFLPVNEVIQFAVPELFRMGENFLLGYQETIRQCRSVALKSLSNCHELSLIPPAGGFYLTASLTGAVHDEEQWVIDLLERCGVLVHPGYFYEIPGIHFVMSFVHESGALEQACRSILSSLRSDNRQHMKNEDASVPPKTQN